MTTHNNTLVDEKGAVISAIALRWWELNSETPPLETRYICQRVLKEIKPKDSAVDDGITKDNIVNMAQSRIVAMSFCEPRSWSCQLSS